MKTATCSSSKYLTPLACHWQPLKVSQHPDQNNDDVGLRMPRSRHKHSACCVGEYVYVFCGKDRTSPLKDAWKFHIEKCHWQAVELQKGRIPFLQGHSIVAFKRLILIFGGTFNGSLEDAQLWTYNTDLNVVQEVNIEAGAAQPSVRRDHTAVVYNNFMYIFGGFVNMTGASQELWAFNIDNWEWIQLTSQSGDQPCRRYGHSAVVADNAVWIFGGLAGISPCADLWRYSFLLHQWQRVKTLGSPPALSGHAACLADHHMVVVGGNSGGKAVNDVWCFNFDTSSWQKMASFQQSELPQLSFHCCVYYRPSPLTGAHMPTDLTQSTPDLSSPHNHMISNVVRPKSSPFAAKQSSVGCSQGQGWTGVQGMQEMNVSGSTSIQLSPLFHHGIKDNDALGGHTNFCCELDDRIHMKDLLAPLSPHKSWIYNSCIPSSFGWNGWGHSPVEDNLQKNELPDWDFPPTAFSTCSLQQLSNCTLSFSDNNLKKAVDTHSQFVKTFNTLKPADRTDLTRSQFIKTFNTLKPADRTDLTRSQFIKTFNTLKPADRTDLTRSQFIKTFNTLKPAMSQTDLKGSRFHKTFTYSLSTDRLNPLGNDLLLEDLDTWDVEYLDQLKISYPSKNQYLSLPQPALIQNSKLPCASQMCNSPSQSQIKDSQKWHQSHLQQEPYNGEMIELKHFMSNSAYADSSSCCQFCPQTDHLDGHKVDNKTGVDLKTLCQCHLAGDGRSPCCNHTTALHETVASAASYREHKGQSDHKWVKKSLGWRKCFSVFKNDIHPTKMDISLTKRYEDFVPKRRTRVESIVSTPCTATNVSQALPGDSVTIATSHLMFQGPGFASGQLNSQHTIKKEAEASEPFLLVIGGRVEQKSIYPKPIALWKGVLH